MIDANHLPKKTIEWILVIAVGIGVPIATSLATNFFLHRSHEKQMVLERQRLSEEMTLERQKLANEAHLEDSKLNIEYVRIALGILQPQKDESEEQKQILGQLAPWAVDVFSKSSPVPLTDHQRSQLMRRAARISYDYDYGFDYGGTSYDYDYRHNPPRQNSPPKSP